MKRNLPVTNTEKLMKDNSILVSKTDLKGKITYCNRDFVEISGFSYTELRGRAHNIIRHPDMPPSAFEDLWVTIQAGKPWAAVVKNRCKNGDYYWAKANVIPIFQGTRIVEYMSVRTKPSRQEVKAAAALYDQINAGKATLAPGPIARTIALIGRIPTWFILLAFVAAAIVLQGLVASRFYGVSHSTNLLLLACSSVVGLGSVWRVYAQSAYATSKLGQMATGNYFDWATFPRKDEFGALAEAIRVAQIQLGFDVMDGRERADEGARLTTALNQVSTGVMMTDNGGGITYINDTLRKIFNAAEEELQSELPDFEAKALMANTLNLFDVAVPGFSQSISNMTTTVTKEFTIGGRSMKVVANPVLDQRGTRIGSVMEWEDRTPLVKIEDDLHGLIDAVQRGNLKSRAGTAGREGFYLHISQGINRLMDTISRVFGELETSMTALAAGDLTKRIVEDYQGTYATIKDSVNQTIENLGTTVSNMHEAITVIDTAAKEVVSGNNNMARAEEQVASLEEIAASMEELTSTIGKTAENTAHATKLAFDACSCAEAGGSVLDRAVSAMDEINQASNKINDIVGVIDEIAFQTNLLSLNASVEAARAGEHGRGFSVVATEVRHLALRSATAAKEIKALITDSVGKVSVGAKLVSESGKTLQEIVGEVRKVGDIIETIAVAADSQSKSIAQVNSAVSSIDKSTQQNTALAEQATGASKALSSRAEDMSAMVRGFKLDSQQARS